MRMKAKKHFIVSKIGYKDRCASFPKLHHRHHLLAKEVKPDGDLRSNPMCLLACAATNQHPRGTNENRCLHEEDKNNNTKNMRKLGNIKKREAKKNSRNNQHQE